MKHKKKKSTLSHFSGLELLVILCLYCVNVPGVCSTCISFILSLCVQSFHILNQLETYVSLLLHFCCFVHHSLVLTLSWLLMLILVSSRYLILATLDLSRYPILAISVELLMYLNRKSEINFSAFFETYVDAAESTVALIEIVLLHIFEVFLAI